MLVLIQQSQQQNLTFTVGGETATVAVAENADARPLSLTIIIARRRFGCVATVAHECVTTAPLMDNTGDTDAVVTINGNSLGAIDVQANFAALAANIKTAIDGNAASSSTFTAT